MTTYYHLYNNEEDDFIEGEINYETSGEVHERKRALEEKGFDVDIQKSKTFMELGYKTTNEEVIYKKVIKEYTIPVRGKEVTVRKWWEQEDAHGIYESDWEFTGDNDLKILDKVGDDERDELYDFISELE